MKPESRLGISFGLLALGAPLAGAVRASLVEVRTSYVAALLASVEEL